MALFQKFLIYIKAYKVEFLTNDSVVLGVPVGHPQGSSMARGRLGNEPTKGAQIGEARRGCCGGAKFSKAQSTYEETECSQSKKW
jgi:hypothetical protein